MIESLIEFLTADSSIVFYCFVGGIAAFIWLVFHKSYVYKAVGTDPKTGDRVVFFQSGCYSDVELVAAFGWRGHDLKDIRIEEGKPEQYKE